MGEEVGSQTNAQDHIKGTGWLTIKSMIQMPWLATRPKGLTLQLIIVMHPY